MIDINTITILIGFGAVVFTLLFGLRNSDAKFDAMTSRIDAQGQRIDAQGQRFDALHREVMEMIKKLK